MSDRITSIQLNRELARSGKRRCAMCKEDKPIEEFMQGSDPRPRSYCIECRKIKSKINNRRPHVTHVNRTLKEKGLRRCAHCHEDKPFDDFYLRDSKPGTYCKSCHNSQFANHRAYVIQERLAWLDEVKLHYGCCLCSPDQFNDPIVLQFHHVDKSTKSENVSTLAGAAQSWKKILDEVAKCVVVCANHHLMMTYGKIDDSTLHPIENLPSCLLP
jgi:hypothetical protein